MSINGDYGRRMNQEEQIYQNNVVTPSIMSSHSNKRQSHHNAAYNHAQ
jgi:hypothetical protein